MEQSYSCCGVGNERLQLVKSFKYLTCKISYEKEKHIQQKPSKPDQTLAILNSNFKPNLVQKFSRIKAHNALAVPILLYRSEIRALEKTITRSGINRDEFFQKNSRVHPFWPQKESIDFGEVESRTGWQETKKIQIKLATCYKNLS